MRLDRGIILLATSHSLYGKMAHNLCLSIKQFGEDIPVALVYDEAGISHLSDIQRSIFDQLIPAQAGGFAGKLHLDLISPFDQTLYLDADMAWMPKHPPSVLFDNLEGADFTGITEGYYDAATGSNEEVNGAYFFWAGIEEIVERYKIKGKIYQWRSEAMYFTKSATVSKMFKKARAIYDNPKLKSVKLFGNHLPDELAINIACAVYDIHPHKYKWTPAYWPKLHGERVPAFEEIYNQYYLLSVGGHSNSPSAHNLYNRLVQVAAGKIGNRFTTFPLTDKVKSIPDRAKI